MNRPDGTAIPAAATGAGHRGSPQLTPFLSPHTISQAAQRGIHNVEEGEVPEGEGARGVEELLDCVLRRDHEKTRCGNGQSVASRLSAFLDTPRSLTELVKLIRRAVKRHEVGGVRLRWVRLWSWGTRAECIAQAERERAYDRGHEERFKKSLHGTRDWDVGEAPQRQAAVDGDEKSALDAAVCPELRGAAEKRGVRAGPAHQAPPPLDHPAPLTIM